MGSCVLTGQAAHVIISLLKASIMLQPWNWPEADTARRMLLFRLLLATVAQLAEQTIRNRQVNGSIPFGGFEPGF